MYSTKGHWVLVSALLFACYTDNSNARSNEGTLRLLHVFFRHGDRSPMKPYQNDPYKNSSYWPDGWGQLTKPGKLRMYKLGQHFRKMYKDFIPREFKNDDMYMYSTDKARTLMSAQAFLAGLYPPESQQMWLPYMPWQPIPVHSMRAEKDPLYPLSKCPRAASELQRVHSLPEVVRIFQEHSKLLTFLEKETGESLASILPYFMLYDTLKTEKENNMILPKWTIGVFPDKMRNLATFIYPLLVYTEDLKKIRAGPMLENMVTSYKRFLNNTQTRRIVFFSVHDANIMFLAEVLSIFRPFIPPYGTALIFELHEQQYHKFAVKVLLLNDTEHAPKVMYIPECTSMCPLSRFFGIATPYIPKDWRSECEGPEISKYNSNVSESVKNSASLLLCKMHGFVVFLFIISISTETL